MSARLFRLNPSIEISAEEGAVLVDAYQKMHGKRKEIGHIVREIAQKAVDDAIARFTMQKEKP